MAYLWPVWRMGRCTFVWWSHTYPLASSFFSSCFSYIISTCIHWAPEAAQTCLVRVRLLHFKMVTVKIWGDINMERIKPVTSSRSCSEESKENRWWRGLADAPLLTLGAACVPELPQGSTGAAVHASRWCSWSSIYYVFTVLLSVVLVQAHVTWGKKPQSRSMCPKPKARMTSFPTLSSINAPERLLIPLTMQLGVSPILLHLYF